MIIDYILTFDKGQQKFDQCEIDPVFPTKDSAVYYFKGLTACSKRHLIKVSMCINCTTQPEIDKLPKWFMTANGKLWSDDLGTIKWNKHWATTSA